MAENDQLITDMLHDIRSSISDLRECMQQQMDRLQHRMSVLETRQSAAMHFDEATLAHLASIHGSMDAFRAALSGSRGVSVVGTH